MNYRINKGSFNIDCYLPFRYHHHYRNPGNNKMNNRKEDISAILAWLGPVHGVLVLSCFISGFLFSSMDAYERIWLIGQILTFGLVEPEFIPYPNPAWLAVWLVCLITNRVLIGKFRFIPWKKKY